MASFTQIRKQLQAFFEPARLLVDPMGVQVDCCAEPHVEEGNEYGTDSSCPEYLRGGGSCGCNAALLRRKKRPADVP